MRKLHLVLAGILAVAACGDNTTTADMTAPLPDLAVPVTPPDMAVPVTPPDLTPPPPDLTPPPPDMTLVCPNTSNPGPDGGTPATNWACVGHYTAPVPAHATYNFPLHVYDYLAKNGIANATVKVCKLTDAMCTTPIAAAVKTDACGNVMLTGVPSSATGLAAYIEIDADPAKYPVVLLYPQTVAPDLAYASGATIGAPLFSSSIFGVVTSVLNVTPDPAKGHVAFAADDCAQNAGPMVTVASTGGGTTYYVAGTLPTKSATATDASGAGFITNITAGSATLTATEGGKAFGTETVTIRAGAITSTNITPNM